LYELIDMVFLSEIEIWSTLIRECIKTLLRPRRSFLIQVEEQKWSIAGDTQSVPALPLIVQHPDLKLGEEEFVGDDLFAFAGIEPTGMVELH
jgi:hypothetical protein|tara:strand:- start:820 stop:1095 length:276 start_codon:yes stop_codon:yes gene_type:complete